MKKETDKEIQGIVWGLQRYPFTFKVNGEPWYIDLRPVHKTLPFSIVLDKFTRELHPRTGIAKVFMSDVTKIENEVSRRIKITMNEPLRHKGYTLYQASWGPPKCEAWTATFFNLCSCEKSIG